MSIRGYKTIILLMALVLGGTMFLTPRISASGGDNILDDQLSMVLSRHGFTGTVGSSLEQRLGRKIDNQLADLGRNLFHDTIVGLNNDNSCSGCHSATAGFGDTQSIAIGVENNFIVGPDRSGPRNQRRTPMAANTAFFPSLMWNSRFASLSFDPFDNSLGFMFPLPEGLTLSDKAHLFARAIAEFEFTLVFANAPLDRYARGEKNVLTENQKRGAILFFGSANCVACHAVSGQSNEMFSDFREHVIGVPQIAPEVRNPTAGNVTFDGPGQNEDFGLEQVTSNPNDRYMFRTSPIRNVALQPAFFHNGTFTRLEDAIRFHLDPSGKHPTTIQRRRASRPIFAALQVPSRRCYYVLIR